MVNHVRQFFSIRVVFSRTLYLWSEVAFLTQVARCPLTQPTSKDTHCIDKRVGNLPASFRSLVLFLGSIAVRSLALVMWTNGTEISSNSGKSLFSENIPPWWSVPFEFFSELPKIPFKWWALELSCACCSQWSLGNYGPISKSKNKFQTLSKMLTKTQQQLIKPADF